MESGEFDGEITDKKLVFDLLKFSTIPLLYLTKDIQKVIAFYLRAAKVNSDVIAWAVFDVCDRKMIVDAIKHSKGYRFLNLKWRKDED